MSRKRITMLSGKVLDKKVFLNCYRSSAISNEDFKNEFKIYRKVCDEFEFNNDYDEFFCGLVPEESELIFQGSLECSNNRQYSFRDENVEVGKTYAYFLQPESSGWVGPVALKVRDPRVWWSYDELHKQLEQLKKDFGAEVEIFVCGKTVQGRDIYALKIGAGKTVLGLLGAVHAGESGPELIVSALRRFLNTKPNMLRNKSIVAIPSLNVDMREELVRGTPWYLRTNSAGVDLNRNFPADWDVVNKDYGLSSDDPGSATYRGRFPGSEPEVKTVIKFFTDNTPECIFSYHALASICDLPGLTAGGTAISDKEFCERAEAYIFTYGSGLHPEQKPEASWWANGGSEGSFARWAYQVLRIPAFDLECSGMVAPEALEICRHDLSDIKLLNEYIDRHSRAINQIMSQE